MSVAAIRPGTLGDVPAMVAMIEDWRRRFEPV